MPAKTCPHCGGIIQQRPSTRAPEWLTLPEVGRRLGCSKEQVRQLCLSGQLACVSIGLGERRRYRVHVDAVERFLSSRTVKTERPARAGVPKTVMGRPNLLGL